MKKKILFVITQFYKGGAETSLLNLFRLLSPEKYDVDFIILNQIEYRDATSLISQIPNWIQVYDVVKNDGKSSFFAQIENKIYRRLYHTETYSKLAIKVVASKKYDVAFSFGEWLSPEFVAKQVNAKKKYVWIHIDLDKADFVNKKELVKYDEYITGYMFASEISMNGAVKCCPEMKDKAHIVHNFLNRAEIFHKSKEALDNIEKKVPYLLSVGNLRVEKNYPRQVEVLKILKQRGNKIKWLCVGSTVNTAVFDEVNALIREYQLNEDFILCGADDNPYKYMQHASAVTVLSDHESWSLVISEAKLLGIPVIATHTSGAQEQLIDGVTGVITSFDELEIAIVIENYLRDYAMQNKIRENLKISETIVDGLKEFEGLI